MQQALAQMHALTCSPRLAEAGQKKSAGQQTPQQQRKKGTGGKAAAAAAASKSSQSGAAPAAGDLRATKAALGGLYGLLSALQSVMSSDGYLKVGRAFDLWDLWDLTLGPNFGTKLWDLTLGPNFGTFGT